MPEKFADLHLHSTASDGTDTPAEVVRRAAALGFAALALADHDTLDGVGEGAAEAQRLGLDFISGVECSTMDGKNEVHVLAYGIDPDNPGANAAFQRLRDERWNRARHMVEKLASIGVILDWDRVREIAGHYNIGRPHIARAMQEAGYISSISEAFTPEYIGTGGQAYVPRERWETTNAITQIRQWGGVPVIAHPGRSGYGLMGITPEDVERYMAAGLMGLEVFYSRHTPEQTAFYLDLAHRYGLLITGGSDDHGSLSDQQFLGTIQLPYRYVEDLKAAIEKA